MPLNGLVSMPKSNIDYASYAKENRFDINKKPPENSSVLFLNGQPVGDRGNFITLTGLAKSRKSVLVSAIITSILKKDGFLGFESFLSESEKIIHIDTEQGDSHYYNCIVRIFKNADLSDLPEFVLSYSVSDADDEEFILGFIQYLLETYTPSLFIVDGVADCVQDINDQREAKKIARLFKSLAKKYNCLFVLVIHLTKGTGNMTGALGTKLEQRCQTAIQVELTEGEEDTSSNVYCKLSRDRRFKTFTIRYNDTEFKYEIIPESQIITKGKGGNKAPEAYNPEIHYSICNLVFGYGSQVPIKGIEKLIAAKIKDKTGDIISANAAKAWVQYYIMNNYLIGGAEGFYLKAVQFKHEDKKPEVDQMQPVIDFNNPADNMDDLPF